MKVKIESNVHYLEQAMTLIGDALRYTEDISQEQFKILYEILEDIANNFYFSREDMRKIGKTLRANKFNTFPSY